MLTDGQTDGRTEWGIAIALSHIGWLGAKNVDSVDLQLFDIFSQIRNGDISG